MPAVLGEYNHEGQEFSTTTVYAHIVPIERHDFLPAKYANGRENKKDLLSRPFAYFAGKILRLNTIYELRFAVDLLHPSRPVSRPGRSRSC